MADKIQIRRDLAANWTSVNPILADGEFGFEKDTGKLKIGNATDDWNTLPYRSTPTSLPWGSITGTLSDQTDLQNALDLKLNIADYNDRYKGKYTTLAALQSAYPTGTAGDYAQVDSGAGSDVINYNWDDEDGWVQGGSGSAATNTDQLPEGSTNLYFTVARVLATLLSGLSVATGGEIVATDSILAAFGKIQYRFNLLLTNFNGANQLVKLDATGKLPAVDGSQLTGINGLPSQTGNAGKFLETDGTNASWQNVAAGTTQNISFSGNYSQSIM